MANGQGSVDTVFLLLMYVCLVILFLDSLQVPISVILISPMNAHFDIIGQGKATNT
jgi:hypothetical protein